MVPLGINGIIQRIIYVFSKLIFLTQQQYKVIQQVDVETEEKLRWTILRQQASMSHNSHFVSLTSFFNVVSCHNHSYGILRHKILQEIPNPTKTYDMHDCITY